MDEDGLQIWRVAVHNKSSGGQPTRRRPLHLGLNEEKKSSPKQMLQNATGPWTLNLFFTIFGSMNEGDKECKYFGCKF